MKKRPGLLCNIIVLLILFFTIVPAAEAVLLWPDAEIPQSMAALSQECVAVQSGETFKIEVFNESRTAFILGVSSSSAGYRLTYSDGIKISLYEIRNVSVPGAEQLAYPDLLIPLGEISQLRFPGKSEGYLWFWMEISSGPEQKMRTDSLAFFASDGKEPLVQIQILRKTAPPVPVPIHIIFNEYGPDYLDGFSGTAEDKAEFEWRVFRLCRAEYGILMPLPYKSQQGTPRPGMAPEIEWIGRDSLKLHWEKFDRRFAPLLDGSAFPDGKPLEAFYLPFNPEWPAPLQLYWNNRPLYEKIWKITAKQFIRHFREKGWTKTNFQIYLNQKPNRQNRIPWNLDEPRGRNDLEALAYFEKLTRRAFPKTGLNILFRVDISHWYCDKHRGHSQKDFELNGGPALLKDVDLWCVSWHSLAGKQARAQAADLIHHGKAVWLYGKTPLITDSGKAVFQDLYNAWLNGWSGFLFWASFTDKIGEENGFDFGWYQIPLGGNMQIVPSLRVKRLAAAVDDLKHLLRRNQGQSEKTALSRGMVANYLNGEVAARSQWYNAATIQ